jgi:hypothetical protein
MRMFKGVCIGGPLDGDTVDCRDKCFEAYIRQPIPDAPTFDDGALVSPIPPRVTYYLDALHFGPVGDLMFWRTSDITPRQAIDRLFAQYVKTIRSPTDRTRAYRYAKDRESAQRRDRK